MRIEKVRLDKYEGPDKEFVTIGKIYEALPNVDEDDGEYAIYDDAEDQHVICPDWCTVIQDEFGVRDTEQQPSNGGVYDAPEYTGESLPPVGTVCEVFIPGRSIWTSVEVVAHVDGLALFRNGNDGIFHGFPSDHFRPIKPEKDKEIEQIMQDCGVARCVAKTIYEEGYRKTK